MRSVSHAFIVLSFVALLGGCSSVRQRTLMTDWEPVHRYPSQARAIPLAPVVEYRVTPVDATLRLLLSRWAYLTGKTVDYRLPQDWTLHADASNVNATTLDAALRALSFAYRDLGVVLEVSGDRLVATSSSSSTIAAGSP